MEEVIFYIIVSDEGEVFSSTTSLFSSTSSPFSPRIDIAQVVVRLTDVNSAPRMTLALLEVYLTESAPFGQEVARLSAVDEDVGVNGVFEYRLEGSPKHGGGEEKKVFVINATTGVVTVNAADALDFEISPTIRLQVKLSTTG